ncbi:MAG: hypothetical protein ABI615_14120, partial [Chthoniobacterales bacterium]
RMAHKTFAIVPEQTLYVDDREENVQEAANQGFIAIHYDYNRHEEFEQDLRARKIHPCSPE